MATRLSSAVTSAAGSIVPGSGVTLPPGRARTRPLMMIFSSPVRPSRTIRRPPGCDGPGPDQLRHDRAVLGDRHHDAVRLVGDDGAVGDEDRLVRVRAGDAQPAELARRDEEVRVRQARARARIVPEPGSMRLSTKFIVPAYGQSSSSGRRACDDRLVVAGRGQVAALDGALVGEEVAPRSCRRRSRSDRAPRSW